MLTSDLLVTRTIKGRIEPIYASPDQDIEIARSVIDAFQRHVGKTNGELMEEIEGFEEINYRLIRGLAQILERGCVIEKSSTIDPFDARRTVFEECKGAVTSPEERKEVLDRAAKKLSIRPDDLEKALWADQEENLILKEFQPIAPENLLRRYNLSLAQTLLFKAISMEIQIEDNYQQIFRKIKQLGLMYSIEQGKVYLDGPVSLFKLTERYGTSLAKLLPTIIRSSRWSLKVSILRKTLQGKRIYDYILDHTSQVFSTEVEAEETFDSSIEKEFYQLNFRGWSIRREPTILKAGNHAFISDFSLERDATKIYVEIIGFWTPEYLRNKIQKINQLKESMILLVDKNLACSGSDFKTGNLIFYDGKIPYLEIIRILGKYEEKQLMEEIAKLRNIEISLEGDVISLDEVARRYSASLGALKEVIKQNKIKINYLLIGNQLISHETLKKIQGELNGVKKHGEAIKIFEDYGIKSYCGVLGFLGYKVKWSGLDSENAEIIKT